MDDLYHYGILGMKWGVRKARLSQRRINKTEEWKNNYSSNIKRAYDNKISRINRREEALRRKKRTEKADIIAQRTKQLIQKKEKELERISKMSYKDVKIEQVKIRGKRVAMNALGMSLGLAIPSAIDYLRYGDYNKVFTNDGYIRGKYKLNNERRFHY